MASATDTRRGEATLRVSALLRAMLGAAVLEIFMWVAAQLAAR
jgi:hypothetical protein